MASRTKDMTQGSPTRLILQFSLPLLAGTILQQLQHGHLTAGQIFGKIIFPHCGQRIIRSFLS